MNPSPETLDPEDPPELLELGCALLEARERIVTRILAGELVAAVVEDERRRLLAEAERIIISLTDIAAYSEGG